MRVTPDAGEQVATLQCEVQAEPCARSAETRLKLCDFQPGAGAFGFRRCDRRAGVARGAAFHVLHDPDALHREVITRQAAGVGTGYRKTVEAKHELWLGETTGRSDRAPGSIDRGVLRRDCRAVRGSARHGVGITERVCVRGRRKADGAA